MSPLAYHGPGDRLDGHNLDAAAHATVFSAVGTSPEIIAPPASLFAASGLAVWFAANRGLYLRFHVPTTKTYRYINWYAGVLSGNVQVGVGSVRRSGTNLYVTKVMDSGVVAMSGLVANSDQRSDCGATSLPSGEYVLFLWCDNTTATFLHGLATGYRANRMMWTYNTDQLTGLGSSEIGTLGGTTRWLAGITLESDS